MAASKWHLSGEYFEACNCDFLCPCLPSNMAAKPTTGECKVALAFHVAQGHFDDEALEGLNFVVVMHAPSAMGEGNMTVGLIVDERASAAQQQALGIIVTGQAGGPMAGLAPLIGKFAGIEAKPIRFEKSGMSCSVVVPGLLDQSIEGLPSAANPGEPIVIDNVAHPVNSRLALAKATRAHLHAFGVDWDDTTGRANGHYAPFTWQA
jgi:hypothetical protein